MFQQAKQKHGDGSLKEKLEVWFVMVSMVLMVVVGIIGVFSSITLGA